MTLQKKTVSDEIGISYLNTDKFKTELLSFSVRTPLTKRGYLLSLVLCGVLRRGTTKLPSMALINRKLDELYATTVDIQSNIHANTLTVSVSAELLNERFSIGGEDISEGVLATVADILLDPLTENGIFPYATVESEKIFVRDSLLAEKNNTRVYAVTRLKELSLRNDESFPTLEYLLDSLDSVSADEVWAFYKRLLSESSLHVFYIGAQDVSSLSDKIASTFASFKGKDIYRFSLPRPSEPLEYTSVTEDMAVNQGKLVACIRMGVSMDDEERGAAIVLNELFGASPASKLFLNVRERLGLCYYCSSSYGMLSGNLTVSSGIEPSKKDEVLSEILRQLDSIKNGDVSDAEFEAARKSLEYSYVQIYDSPFSLQGFYSVRDIFGVNESVEECKKKILSVTKTDVCRLAERLVCDTVFFINGTLSGAEDDDE